MKLAFYVHDLYKTIGHSRSTIDMINALPQDEVSQILFICYTHDNIKTLFPRIHHKISVYKFPILSSPKPFLLKSIFFQIYAFFLNFIISKDFIKISLGIAHIFSDCYIVHFIHKQWEPHYFKMYKLDNIALIYKRILFYYYDLCENIIYRLQPKKTISVSDLLSNFLRCEFSPTLIKTIHSGISSSDFHLSYSTKEEAWLELCRIHPKCHDIDINKPISFFAGAWKRKGLDKIIDNLKSLDVQQLIIIGLSDSQIKIDIDHQNITYIPFTEHINLFFEVADNFIFPTVYEPWGLVVIEAFAMGINIYAPPNSSGAVRFLGKNQVKTVKDWSHFQVDKLSLSHAQKKIIIQKRQKILEELSWQKVALEYFSFFKSNF